MKISQVFFAGFVVFYSLSALEAQQIAINDLFSYANATAFKAEWPDTVGTGIFCVPGNFSVSLANSLAVRDIGPTQFIRPRQPWSLTCGIGQTAFQRGQWFGLFTTDMCHGYIARWDSSTAQSYGGCGFFAIYSYNSATPITVWNSALGSPLITKPSLHPVLPTAIVNMQMSSTWDAASNKRILSLTVPNLNGASTTLQTEVADVDTRVYTRLVLSGNTSGIFANLALSSTPQIFNAINYGATGDGTTDDTVALTNAIAAAESVGGGVYLPATPHAYKYSSCVTIQGISVWGDGNASLLQAANPLQSALILTGDHPYLSNLKIISPQSSGVGRQVAPQTAAVMINQATNFLVSGITVDTTASVGIISLGGAGTATNPAQICNCTVTNTLADGIHMTEQSAYINVVGNTVTNTGDDMYAVVSYTRDGGLCHDIQIIGNVGSGQSGEGRGISVVGGASVNIVNNTISNTLGAGIYLVSELIRNPDGSLLYKTFGDNAITVQGNILMNLSSSVYNAGINIGGRAADTTDSGQTESSDQLITNVLLLNNSVTNSYHSGISLQSYFNGISIEANTITASSENGIEVFGGSNLYVGDQTGNTIRQSGNFGMFVGTNSVLTTITGQSLVIDNNSFVNSNVSGVTLLPVIYLSQQIPGLSMANNQFSNTNNYLMALPSVQFGTP